MAKITALNLVSACNRGPGIALDDGSELIAGTVTVVGNGGGGIVTHTAAKSEPVANRSRLRRWIGWFFDAVVGRLGTAIGANVISRHLDL